MHLNSEFYIFLCHPKNWNTRNFRGLRPLNPHRGAVPGPNHQLHWHLSALCTPRRLVLQSHFASFDQLHHPNEKPGYGPDGAVVILAILWRGVGLWTCPGPYQTWTDLKWVRRLNFLNAVYQTRFGPRFGLSSSFGPATGPKKSVAERWTSPL